MKTIAPQLIVFILVSICFINLNGQGQFYDIEQVQEIRLEFTEDNWADILDEYYVVGDGSRLTGTLFVNGTRLDSVGVRYKGFSSVSVDRTKNPFNIKLDHVINQDYKGLDKIKLGNVIHDPTFVREALSYEIARKYLPASRSNFAELYVNDKYLGLYSNVESVDDNFLDKYFYSDNNAFFKGNPDELDFNGENSNLSDSPGTDTLAYKPFYDKESKDGWKELVDFIHVLNQELSRIEEYLNVDRTLWMHAFNYVLVNLDSYIGYGQNYYLYEDEAGLFNPIPWDLNMSFGSFRITDASDFFDGVSIEQAKVLDPLAHYSSVSVFPRPLMRKLFENDSYRKMYLAHIRTIVEENFSNGNYIDRINEIQNSIRTSVLNDTNKFYSDIGFESNVVETYSDLIAYPGLIELMDARAVYLMDYTAASADITVEPLDQISAAPVNSMIEITAKTKNATRVILAYRYDKEDAFLVQEMEEFTAGWWTAEVPMKTGDLDYYFYAENATAGVFSPKRAAYEFHNILPIVDNQIGFNDIVINEFMASNESTRADEEGEFDDWIELYNTTNSVISLEGLHLSDKEGDFEKWEFPDTLIGPNSYLIVWADEDGSQGPMHANFKLSSGGEYISLAYADETIIDDIEFGEQITDQATGRLPNGTGPFVPLIPTFSSANTTSDVDDFIDLVKIDLFPNPATNILNIVLSEPKLASIQVTNSLGQVVFLDKTFKENISIDLSALQSGAYNVIIKIDEKYKTHEFIKI